MAVENTYSYISFVVKCSEIGFTLSRMFPYLRQSPFHLLHGERMPQVQASVTVPCGRFPRMLPQAAVL